MLPKVAVIRTGIVKSCHADPFVTESSLQFEDRKKLKPTAKEAVESIEKAQTKVREAVSAFVTEQTRKKN